VNKITDKIKWPSAKCHFKSLIGSKQIGHHRKRRAFDPSKKKSGTFIGNHPAMDFGNLKIRVNFPVNGQELVIFF
jgi:hypothetical protein